MPFTSPYTYIFHLRFSTDRIGTSTSVIIVFTMPSVCSDDIRHHQQPLWQNCSTQLKSEGLKDKRTRTRSLIWTVDIYLGLNGALVRQSSFWPSRKNVNKNKGQSGSPHRADLQDDQSARGRRAPPSGSKVTGQGRPGYIIVLK